MSPRIPVMNADEVIKLLSRHGFVKVKQRGSHLKMRSPEGKTIIIPIHSGKNIKPGLLLSIFNQAEIDVSEIRR